jgi:hypothetical protein
MKTYEEINERIVRKKAVVMTAEEIMEWNEKGLAAGRDWDGLPWWDSALLHLNFT